MSATPARGLARHWGAFGRCTPKHSRPWHSRRGSLPLARRVVNSGPAGAEVRLRIMLIALRGV